MNKGRKVTLPKKVIFLRKATLPYPALHNMLPVLRLELKGTNFTNTQSWQLQPDAARPKDN